MPHYLISAYLPDDYDPSLETQETVDAIHALNREMIAAGVRKFAGGLAPAATGKTLRKQADGKVLMTDGPYAETKEHVGGLSIVEVANMEAALEWARRGALMSRGAVEVREIFFRPAPTVEPDGSK